MFKRNITTNYQIAVNVMITVGNPLIGDFENEYFEKNFGNCQKNACSGVLI